MQRLIKYNQLFTNQTAIHILFGHSALYSALCTALFNTHIAHHRHSAMVQAKNKNRNQTKKQQKDRRLWYRQNIQHASVIFWMESHQMGCIVFAELKWMARVYFFFFSLFHSFTVDCLTNLVLLTFYLLFVGNNLHPWDDVLIRMKNGCTNCTLNTEHCLMYRRLCAHWIQFASSFP